MFGDTLKLLREKRGWTQTELGEKVDMAKSTISMLERGKRMPSYELLEAFADVFNVDMNILTGKTNALPTKITTMSAESTINTNCPVVPIYNALNDAGRKEYVRYGRYLTAQPEFLAPDAQPQVEYIRHYLTAAAAGYAAPIEGEDFEEIPLPADAPTGADFCIDIAGDSMEPYIKDGSRVYVKRGADVKEMNDVGIFFVDGDVFCKQWCVDYAGTLHLLSANPKRESANKQIAKDASSSVVCFGKVLVGKKLPMPSYY